MLSLNKFINDTWERARYSLLEDLEHLEIAINNWRGNTFDDSNQLLGTAIQGDINAGVRYISNQGVDASGNPAPLWDQVDLGSDGVRNRLDYSHLKAAVIAPSVIGALTNGDFGEIPASSIGGGGASTSLIFMLMGS